MRTYLLLIILLVSLCTVGLAMTYQVKTQIITVDTTADKLPSTALVGREYVCVQNVGAVALYIGASTVTADEEATGGLQILPYSVWCGNYDHTVDVYGIVASGTCATVVEEGK